MGSCLAGIYLFPRERRTIFISSLLSLPAASCELVFIPEYWYPTRVTGFTIGIEDIIFSFATGGIVWIIISVIIAKKISYNLSPRTVIKRYLILAMLGLTMIFISRRFVKWGVMNEALVGILIVGLILMVRLRFKTWRIAAAGSFLFALYYFIILNIILNLFPEFGSYWNNSNLWNIFVLKIPLEEIAWAFAFGAVWPLAMAYVFDLKLLLEKTGGAEET